MNLTMYTYCILNNNRGCKIAKGIVCIQSKVNKRGIIIPFFVKWNELKFRMWLILNHMRMLRCPHSLCSLDPLNIIQLLTGIGRLKTFASLILLHNVNNFTEKGENINMKYYMASMYQRIKSLVFQAGFTTLPCRYFLLG